MIEPITSGAYGALIANPVHVDAVMIDGNRFTVLRQKAHDTWPDGSEYYATVYVPAYAIALVKADDLRQQNPAPLLDRLHTAEARCAILESKWNSVPWDDLYTCIVIAAGTGAAGDDRQAIVRAASWHDVNEPEATE